MGTLEIRTDILIKIFLVVILIFESTNISFAGSPGTYREQSYEMIDKVKKVLISNNYCDSKKNCSKKEFFFVGPNSDGFNVTVYGIISAKIVNKINTIATEIYFKNKQKLTIKTFFREKKHKDFSKLPLWLGGDKSFISLKLEKQGE